MDAANHKVPAFRVYSGDSARNDEFLYVQVEPGELGTALVILVDNFPLSPEILKALFLQVSVLLY